MVGPPGRPAAAASCVSSLAGGWAGATVIIDDGLTPMTLQPEMEGINAIAKQQMTRD